MKPPPLSARLIERLGVVMGEELRMLEDTLSERGESAPDPTPSKDSDRLVLVRLDAVFPDAATAACPDDISFRRCLAKQRRHRKPSVFVPLQTTQ